MEIRFITLARRESDAFGLLQNLEKQCGNLSVEFCPDVHFSPHIANREERSPSSTGTMVHVGIGAHSIAAGYNHTVRQFRNPPAHLRQTIYCFIHTDARLHFNPLERIPDYFNALHEPGVIGFVGCGNITLDSRWWLGEPRFGSLIQGGFPPEDGPNLKFLPPCNRYVKQSTPTPPNADDFWRECLPVFLAQPVDAVDGYCMFIRASVFREIYGFDQDKYGHWHCYDADLCLTALANGYQNYVINELTQHFSGGSLADPWSSENQKFIAKWSNWIVRRGLNVR